MNELNYIVIDTFTFLLRLILRKTMWGSYYSPNFQIRTWASIRQETCLRFLATSSDRHRVIPKLVWFLLHTNATFKVLCFLLYYLSKCNQVIFQLSGRNHLTQPFYSIHESTRIREVKCCPRTQLFINKV